MKFKAVKRELRHNGYYLQRTKEPRVSKIRHEDDHFIYGWLTFDRENNWASYTLMSATAYQQEMTSHLDSIISPLWECNY